VLKDVLQSLAGIGGLGHNHKVGLVLQLTSNSLTEQDMIMHDDAANFPAGNFFRLDLCMGGHSSSCCEF
jgi:hypothetical protein